MRILFDLVSQQDTIINGGSLYGYKVFYELCKKDGTVFGFYDSRLKLNEKTIKLCEEYSIKLFDIAKEKLEDICRREQIDKVFIAIAQRFRKIDLQKIECDVYIVCHDISNLVLSESGMYSQKKMLKYFSKVSLSPFSLKSIFLRFFAKNYNYYNYYKKLINLFKQKNVHVITVSEYSKGALEFYFSKFANEIKVYFPPEKITDFVSEIKTVNIRQLIESKKKYILLISCDRFNKNVHVFTKQFQKLNQKLGGEYTAVLVGKTKIKGNNILVLDAVEGADLEHLYKNAEMFVYPTLAEGFGYPPIEAMRYGTPIVAAYSTSVPEALGAGAVYFNPMYAEDLYSKLLFAVKEKDKLREYSLLRYEEISKLQALSLNNLIDLICS